MVAAAMSSPRATGRSVAATMVHTQRAAISASLVSAIRERSGNGYSRYANTNARASGCPPSRRPSLCRPASVSTSKQTAGSNVAGTAGAGGKMAANGMYA